MKLNSKKLIIFLSDPNIPDEMKKLVTDLVQIYVGLKERSNKNKYDKGISLLRDLELLTFGTEINE